MMTRLTFNLTSMRRLLLVLTIFVLAGCATGPHIDRSFSATGQDSRVRFLVIHYTAVPRAESLKILTQQAVSAHYLVEDQTGHIYGLVDENRRAWQAGVSYWRGFNNLNSSSVGIEIVNEGYKDTPNGRVWIAYDEKQLDAVMQLVEDIIKRNNILPENVVGHSDIAPQRKTDPGPLFPWKRLADKGLISWPNAERVAARLPEYSAVLPDAVWFQKKLTEVGYLVPQNGVIDKETTNVIAAFQMKYRPGKFDGAPDAETAAMLDVLTTPITAAPAACCSQMKK
jgi:N-acetylmuramoyl-L-alanine amidase